jgi:large subunit ribosomal protein L25
MASNSPFQLEANLRQQVGKGASRRLRREEKVPAILYGGGKAPEPITLEHKAIAKSLENEAFYSHILTLKTGAETERVILKDVVRHAFKPRILHVDFQRVRADEKLNMNIPLHFIGETIAPGVKDAGGILSHIMNDVEVTCFPDDLPEFIEVDVSSLQLNDILHLSDLKLPKGVELVDLAHDDNKAVVSVHMPRIEEEPEPMEEAGAAPSQVPATAQKGEEEGESESEGKGKGQ